MSVFRHTLYLLPYSIGLQGGLAHVCILTHTVPATLFHWTALQAINVPCCKSLRRCYRKTIAVGRNKKKYCK